MNIKYLSDLTGAFYRNIIIISFKYIINYKSDIASSMISKPLLVV
jgi:hypothetical protein